MATYRQVHISFWQDGFILTLTPEEKYFYLYLMTNSKTTQCGIYELPLKVMEMETGYNADKVFALIQTFINYKKILYNEETREIMILNWIKHNSIRSPKVIACIDKELKNVKSDEYTKRFISICNQYGYCIDSLSIDLGEEEEKEEEKEEEVYRRFDHLSITQNEFKRLISEGYSKRSIDDILDRVENAAGNKKYKSLILTARNWLKNDKSKVSTMPQPKTEEMTQEERDFFADVRRKQEERNKVRTAL